MGVHLQCRSDRRRATLAHVAVVWSLTICGVALAQAPPPVTPAQAPSAVPAPASPVPPHNDRIFGVLPNYTTVELVHGLPPLSARAKIDLAAEGTFDPVEIGFYGVLAGLNQITHENPSWGYSWAGYGRRYAEAFANTGIENFMTTGIGAAVLHEDPRYFQLEQGGVAHRILYAASRIVITLGDNGRHQFNASEWGGSLAAAGISNFYEPRSERTVANTGEVWATQVAIDTWSNELRRPCQSRR